MDREISTILCIITGDIAFAGKVNEYNVAKKLLLKLKNLIESIEHVTIFRIFIVPGNHDCLFESGDTVRDMVIKAVIDDPLKIDKKVIETTTSVQGNFEKFVSDVSPYEYEHYTNCVKKISINVGVCIEINLFNTAWMSQLHESKGSLAFPVNVIPDPEQKTALTITCFHHPTSWLGENCSRIFKKKIESISDIILTGHEHVSDMEAKQTMSGVNVEYIEGGVLFDNSGENQSEFNFLAIDLHSMTQEVYQIKEIESLYSIVAKRTLPFARNSHVISNTFSFTEAANNHLNDPGANFRHPAKEKLTLDDIFIYPSFDIGDSDPLLQDRIETLKSDAAQEYFLKANRVILIGEDKSGKTTIAKKLALIFNEKNKIPLLVDCSNISRKKAKNCFADIISEFSKYYSESLLERFKQASKDDKVLILDNFHKLICSTEEKNILLNTLEEHFSQIFLTCDEIFQTSEFTNDKHSINKILGYEKIFIQQFNRYLREQLIEKWVQLDRETYTSVDNLSFMVDEYSRIINIFFGSKFIPYYPLFILIILQQIHSKRSIEGFTGSYGQLIETLITQALDLSRGIDLFTKHTYLSNLAFKMFKEKTRVLDSALLSDFHIKYISIYKETFGLEQILSELIYSNILCRNNGYIKFPYNYFYYYFVAKYISQNYTDDISLQELIPHMVHHIYVDEYSHILLFLSYLSDHKTVIIKSILTSAEKIYGDYRPCDFTDDIKFANDLIGYHPSVQIKEPDGKKSRKAALIALDQIDGGLHGKNDENDFCGVAEQEEVEQIDEFICLTVSFRYIDILGQILKNFAGSLRGDLRSNITDTCYQLGLRSLQFVFKSLSDNFEEWKDMFIPLLKEKFPDMSDENLMIKIHRAIFVFYFYISMSIIKKISLSMGSERLKLTFSDVKKAKNILPYDIIDLSIRFDSFRDFPEKELLDIFSKIDESNYCVNLLLKHLTITRFKMLPTKSDVRHRVCEKIGIKIQASLMG